MAAVQHLHHAPCPDVAGWNCNVPDDIAGNLVRIALIEAGCGIGYSVCGQMAGASASIATLVAVFTGIVLLVGRGKVTDKDQRGREMPVLGGRLGMEAPLIGKEEVQLLREEGAAMRAADPESFWQNPALRTENMPNATGEARRDWIDRHDAWREGWLRADASGEHGICRAAPSELLFLRQSDDCAPSLW